MITVVCPVFNEEKDIKKLLEFLISSAPAKKEIIFIDGGSNDNTINIINEWATKSSNIQLLHNTKKFVPYALNLAIKNSTGDPIIRLDAHTEYSTDYFQKILECFEETNADIVGGPMLKKGVSSFQKAVAYCTSCIFGIGDSKIHKENYSGPSDHVYLGAWKRELFSQVGYFDEKLLRNQDDEFHYRAKSFGKSIYLSSTIKSHYHPRNTYKKLFIQYFQYGLFKPIVLKKIKSGIKIRHLMPAVFVIYLLTLPLWISFNIWALPLIAYIVLNLFFSSKSNLIIKSKIYSLIIFPIIHFAYGFGFIIGSFDLLTRRFELIIAKKF